MNKADQHLPQNWRLRSLDSLGKVLSGATPSTRVPDFWNGDIAWITPADLSRQETPYINSTARSISEKGLTNCAATLIPKRNIVISSRAPIGYIAVPTIDFTTNQGCKTLWLGDHQHYLFHYYNLCFHVRQLKEKGEGTTFSEISKAALEMISLPVPNSESAQVVIGQILGSADRTIECLRALVTKHKRIKRGVIRNLLALGIDNDGRIRSESTHTFKNSLLGRISEDWRLIRTKEACSLITKGATPKKRAVENAEYTIPFLRVQNLTFDGRIDFRNDLEFISRETHRHELARSAVRYRDVLMNIVGPPLGKVGIVPNHYPEWNVNQAIALFRPTRELCSDFLFYWLQSPQARTWFEINSKKTSGQQNLTLQHCQDLPLLLPSFEEQQRIVSSIRTVEAALDIEQQYIRTLLSQKAGLMHDLLTGRVSVDKLVGFETAAGQS
jgi:type I restriction enzyme S subunit